jgi:hypothetical protein
MLAPFRLSRLLLAGLAACAVTWAMAAGALGLPLQAPGHSGDSGDRPAYKDVAGDVKEPQTAARPDFAIVPGDVKQPEFGGRPEFKAVVGDVKSDADRARAVPPVVPNTPAGGPAAPSDDTSTVALVLSIAAILTALGAVTLTVTRRPRGVLRA